MVENLTPIFLCGYPKSGTTLLLSLFDSHEELLVFPEELKFFQKVLTTFRKSKKRKIILSETGAYIPSLGEVNFASGKRVYTSIDGKSYFCSLKRLLCNATNSRDMFLKIFENWKNFAPVKTVSLKYLMEKTPQNELYLSTIKKWFPNSKFIHIVRDPRDNFLTYRKKSSLSLEEFAYSWGLSTNIGMAMEGENYSLIKYEDLVSDPRHVMQKVCKWLDIKYDNILLSPTRNRIIWEGNSMFGSNEGKIHLLSVGRYKKHLSVDEIKFIEGCLHDDLIKLNYEINYAKCKMKLPMSMAERIHNFLKFKGRVVFKNLCANF